MPVYPWPFIFFFSLFLLLLPLVFPLNQQGEALLSWKRTLNGSSIQVLSNWDPADETPCRWFGISCNYKNEVAEMELKYIDLLGNVPSNLTSLWTLRRMVLPGTNLTGPIPQQIGELHQLMMLDLSNNELTGEIPTGICFLTKLEHLYLQTNSLEGDIPAEIGSLTGLVELMLYDNKLKGGMPASIGNMKYLQVIRAGGNKNLQGSIPLEIGNCTNLVLFGVAETSISGFLPPTIGMLKKLQTLAVYTTRLSGEIPLEIGDCISLQNIYLYENSLTGSIPTQLGNLQNLQNLLLWQNNFVGTIPPQLGSCNQLVVIDMSMNSLTGMIPESFGNLTLLQELQLSLNQLSGRIPFQLGNCRGLTHIELDNNQISGGIPTEIGNLTNLTVLFLWQNHLEGNIPVSLSNCEKLEALDVSENELTGPIPGGIFQLEKLSKLLLLSNNLSGTIPLEIGNCSSLIRFRASNNELTGDVPASVGRLKNVNFLDLGSNGLSGNIPVEICECQNLTFLDLHSNSFAGNLPVNLSLLSALQFLDVSDNVIEGVLDSSLGSLTSLTKLVLGQNKFSGSIPAEIGLLSRLQLLDLSSNDLVGPIPASIGKIPGLEIALNLSWNQLSGLIPVEFTALDRLGVLDISHNHLTGDIHYLAELQNLVVLNISDNEFSGRVPDTPFFAKLPVSVLAGNPDLCFSGNECSGRSTDGAIRRRTARVAIAVLLCTASVLLLTVFYIIISAKIRGRRALIDCDLNSEDDVQLRGPWEVTVYQKLDLSIIDVAKCLTAVNMIGQGRSGVVYRALTTSGSTIAVKRFRSSEKLSTTAFTSEITTLARIRHRNIVRLLGWASNSKMKLILYDYMPNGTLGALLHDGQRNRVDWEIRFKIALGVAEGLAYLHHDCVPPILHRDIKTHNILLGECYEPCVADFGIARFMEDETGRTDSANPQFAGSYGYFAPEYSSMVNITEKSDVYSYGIVLLEIITRKKPVDPTFPDGYHVIQWVRDHLKSKKDPVDIVDQQLQGNSDTQIQEMLQALGIALLCTSIRPEDRPTMNDIVALLKEIKHEPPAGTEQGAHKPRNKTSDGATEGPTYSSTTSLSPARFMMVQGSSNCSSMANYSCSSTSYNMRHQ